MISKSKNLVALFTALFLLLLGIQVYFMYQTYQVKKREIYRTVYDRLDDYTDKFEDKGGIRKITNDSVQKIFIQYHNREITKKDFTDYFERNRKNSENEFSNFVDNQFKKEGYRIAARVAYLQIIFTPDSSNLIDKPIILFETRNKLVKAGVSNTGRWETSSVSESGISRKFDRNNTFLVKSETGFEILNIKSVVFRELTLLILSCIILLLSVLMLYIFTVKNLVQQQKQVEVLHTVVDNISHEFKTPIATLKIASKALKKNLNPETLPLIDRQIARLESLMLQLHQDQTTGTIAEIQPEDWNLFIEDLSFTYPETRFILKNEIEQNLSFDKTLMETIIKNLCENSVKYGASDVKVDISNPQQHLEIIVSDNGQGIEKHELKNIFEKFYRIQSNNIHNNKGLGLGLYFVQNIIKKYHGKIDVISQLKEGTTFKIRIPYEN
ncbi:hypothetical protein IQ37_19455 [Chryseobacterium piperi]|uniref:histidine kinase n=1 Tax=Chryseobacterium piperi TaxID=558152 RepID=A0A086A4X2_9FLAO|nr:HAMP domain-containing sensor histidine kinase [Chryseobacterium piperi]ASW74851.1 sensor histidine kinase [Chryseobacterium piperi]KFF11736.1 hypothetical protein IQ37_19455 [Chryseobacterium piperi]